MAHQMKPRRNQFGDIVEGEDKYLTLENWQDVWQAGKTNFHNGRVHPMLLKHFSLIVNDRKAPLRIFLPLSGKSLDLKWLANQGHQVIGNEISLMACEQFFQENQLEYEVVDLDGIEGKCVQSRDKKYNVKIYCCDFFNLTRNIIGHLDAVWDRGAFVAVHPSDRKRYAKTMKSLLSADTRYLLDVFSMDHTVFSGPPFSTTIEELTALYDNCRIEKIDEKDAFTEWQRQWGLKEFVELDFLLIKNSQSAL